MKIVLVLACILAIAVPFEASSSESKERKYLGRYCPPCPPCPDVSYYPPPPPNWPVYPPPPGAAPGGPPGAPQPPVFR